MLRKTDKRKVLILSCGTGEGHNSAAKALAENLNGRGIECEIKDSVSFRSEKARRRITGLYNRLIRRAPALFGCIYKLGALYDRLGLPSPIYAYHASYAEKLYAYIKEGGFTHVLCTHLFGMETVTAVRKKYAPDLPCYGILTDYTDVPFYKDTELDGYFVANGRSKEQLIEKKKRGDRIFCTGIPVSAKFSAGGEDARRRLSLPQDKKILVVMSGGAGCGKIVGLCRKLRRSPVGNACVCLFTGNNGKLKRKLTKRFGSDSRFRIVGFTNEVYLYLKAADLVFSKPGGLSSTEIAVSNVPLVQLKAIPGCETENRKYFTRNGLSVYARSARVAVQKASALLSDPCALTFMTENQRRLIPPDSCDRIVDRILEAQHD